MLRRTVGIRESLFFVIYTVYCIDIIIGGSLIDIPDAAGKLMRLIFVLLALIKIIRFDEYTTREILIIGLVICSLLLMRIFGGYSKPIWTIIMVFSANRVDFKNILKVSFINILILAGVVVCACLIGAIPDYTFIHNMGGRNVVAHSFGFSYYSTLAYYAMAITIIYIYLRKESLRLYELTILVVLNYLFYQVHTTRLSFYLTILFVALYLIIVRFKMIRLSGRFWKTVATSLPFGFFGGTFLLVFLHRYAILNFSSSILKTIVSRLNFSIRGINEYGIKLFGSKFEMVGNTDLIYGSANKGWYIDSAYVYIVLAYGLVFSFILIALYTVVYRYIYYRRENIIFIWMGTILLGCCINNFILSPVLNPLLFLIPEAVSKMGSELRYRGGYSEQVGSSQYTEY